MLILKQAKWNTKPEKVSMSQSLLLFNPHIGLFFVLSNPMLNPLYKLIAIAIPILLIIRLNYTLSRLSQRSYRVTL